MKLEDSPLRLLVKSYSSGILERDQYLKVRQQLLKKLAHEGDVSQEDLQNFLKIYQETDTKGYNRYSASDWLIIALGLIAALSLGTILFS